MPKTLFQPSKPTQSRGDKKIFRRSYEKHLAEVKMPHHYAGFTNRILVQQPDEKTVNYFIPVYVIFKIKSIQDIDIQKLVGSISCVMIINIQIQNLPEPIVHLLETGVNIQLNRSELVELKESQENNISFSKKAKMMSFTIRRTVTGTIVEETLWSPFEIIRLIISLTFNSIKKDGEEIVYSYLQYQAQQESSYEKKIQLGSVIKEIGKMYIPQDQSPMKKRRKEPEISFDGSKKYNISFNCMRNGSSIPISYALGCVYSLYDLAQRKLETYHTNLDSYAEIVDRYKQSKQQSQGNKQKEEKVNQKTERDFMKKSSSKMITNQFQFDQQVSSELIEQYLDQIYEKSDGNKEKKGLPKAKYYQFTHLVIPLYKYPENALATMFIPIFLLALLSLAIFYQDNQLSSRIGSIATMVLGYIALIPSIKEQLPPSSKITVIQRVIYLSTMCCLLCLIQSFLVDGIEDYEFEWSKNWLFKCCLGIHLSIFMFIFSLLAIHKLIWQKSYNYDKQVISPDPQKEKDSWINLYCDQEFFKTNDKIYKSNPKNASKLIRKYQPTFIERQPLQEKLQNIALELQTPIKSGKKKPKNEYPSQQVSALKSQFETAGPSTLSVNTTQSLLSVKADDQARNPSKDKKEKPKLKHQANLQELDRIISIGKHVILTARKDRKSPEKSKGQKKFD